MASERSDAASSAWYDASKFINNKIAAQLMEPLFDNLWARAIATGRATESDIDKMTDAFAAGEIQDPRKRRLEFAS